MPAPILLAVLIITAAPVLGRAGENPSPLLRIEPERAVLENRFLSMEISLAEKRVRTVAVANRRTEETSALEGDDFVLVFAGGRKAKSREFLLEKVEESDAPGDGRALLCHLVAGDLRVRLRAEIRPERWWIERWIEIEGQSGRLEKVSLAEWKTQGARGPTALGKTVEGLGFPQGAGQGVYVDDLFFAIAHPGAENLARGKRISCRIGAYQELAPGRPVAIPRLLVGAGEAGAGWAALVGAIDQRRSVPARMVFLVNDWYWKDKTRTVEEVAALAAAVKAARVPIDSFTLDDGWDAIPGAGLWAGLDPGRFPGGWEALAAAARPAGMGVSVWWGPIGGYGGRDQRVEAGRTQGLEINGDKLCLAGERYRKLAAETFAAWARRGADYIKVDGFWPDCEVAGHGHPVGPGADIAQMDALIEVLAAWRRARPDLRIAYTSGSNPSPFWLEHADGLWRGGADDSHAGAGEPFDRHSTYIDGCLQAHRPTDLPISALVTFDIVEPRIAGTSDGAFERNAWWLAARTSLHHDWYLQGADLSPERWRVLAAAARWAQGHQRLFRLGRMVGGDPREGDIYGFSAWEGTAGTLALRNPSAEARTLERSLSNLLDLPWKIRKDSFRLKGVHGETEGLAGIHAGTARLKVELPGLAVAVFEVAKE